MDNQLSMEAGLQPAKGAAWTPARRILLRAQRPNLSVDAESIADLQNGWRDAFPIFRQGNELTAHAVQESAARIASATCSCWPAVIRLKNGNASVRRAMDSVRAREPAVRPPQARQTGCKWMGAK